MKIPTQMTIEQEVKEKAKELGFNISEVAEEALIKKIEEATMKEKVNSEHRCEFCGKIDRLATRDDLTGLTWLWPDERWICESCLKAKTAAMTVAASIHQ
jgi:post-segregation antitoxin (ccd killing protein)